jgi:hypothetical protein
MKKLIVLLVILAITVGGAFADDGTVTVKRGTTPNGMETVLFTWIANSGGTVPATSTLGNWPSYNAGCISKVNTNPGSTAPTDNYDITLTDSDGIDLMGGELANRDTANSEVAVPKVDTVFGCVVVTEAFTLNISGNSVDSATGTVTVYIIN